MAAPVVTPERLGDLLVREKLITREQLDKALQEQKQSGTRIGYNLVKLGFIAETELTKILARQFKMPAVDLTRFEVDPRIAKLIPSELATKHLVLPLKRDGRTLTVAVTTGPWGAQARFLAEEIRRKANEALGSEEVDKVTIVVRDDPHKPL